MKIINEKGGGRRGREHGGKGDQREETGIKGSGRKEDRRRRRVSVEEEDMRGEGREFQILAVRDMKFWSCESEWVRGTEIRKL